MAAPATGRDTASAAAVTPNGQARKTCPPSIIVTHFEDENVTQLVKAAGLRDVEVRPPWAKARLRIRNR